MAEPIQIGILLYPNVTQLDATGPAQVLCRVPGATLHMIWKTRDPVPTDAGFSIVPTTTFADCPKLDVICVPGGGGQVELMGDPETLDFLRKQAATARYVTSVCTGSLVLGAALRSQRRTSSRAITFLRPSEPPATSRVSGWPPMRRLSSATPALEATVPPSGETMRRS